MARVTVEDCLENEPNRFNLVKVASLRAKEILSGSAPMTTHKGNRAVVTALREIAEGKVDATRYAAKVELNKDEVAEVAVSKPIKFLPGLK